jgi:hypothetical protein
MLTDIGSGNKEEDTCCSTSSPPIPQQANGVGVGVRVGRGVLVDQGVSVGIEGTVIVGVSVGGSVAVVCVCPQAASRKARMKEKIRENFFISIMIVR